MTIDWDDFINDATDNHPYTPPHEFDSFFPSHPPLNIIVPGAVDCPVCGNTRWQTAAERAYYLRLGLTPPTICPECQAASGKGDDGK
jgi:ssDNA-binding Zn-finger/Zn-ribbon topoisomerase 1